MTPTRPVSWLVAGVPVEGELFLPADADSAVPCVILAHGLGGTRDSGLEPFARAFTAAGYAALTFDYRHFGTSGGEPRQLIDPARQRADYHGAIGAVRSLPEVDPDRVVLWGISYSGGHVLQVAKEDDKVAAVLALVPATDGPAALVHGLRHSGLAWSIRLSASLLRAAMRRGDDGRALVRLVGAGSEPVVLAGAVSATQYLRAAGPTWRNEIRGSALLTGWRYRPAKVAAGLSCPILIQIADQDSVAPPRAAAKSARALRAVVRHYPCDHFAPLADPELRRRIIDHQVAFLRRHVESSVVFSTSQ